MVNFLRKQIGSDLLAISGQGISALMVTVCLSRSAAGGLYCEDVSHSPGMMSIGKFRNNPVSRVSPRLVPKEPSPRRATDSIGPAGSP
jgi:hypothetical protein